MRILLWLDDIRNPFEGDWVKRYAPDFFFDSDNVRIKWIKNYSEFTQWIKENGLPDTIAFDHDLGENNDEIEEQIKSGFDCAKWLVNYCIDNQIGLPKWTIQSANPVGKNNINCLLNNFLSHIIKKNKKL